MRTQEAIDCFAQSLGVVEGDCVSGAADFGELTPNQALLCHLLSDGARQNRGPDAPNHEGRCSNLAQFSPERVLGGFARLRAWSFEAGVELFFKGASLVGAKSMLGEASEYALVGKSVVWSDGPEVLFDTAHRAGGSRRVGKDLASSRTLARRPAIDENQGRGVCARSDHMAQSDVRPHGVADQWGSFEAHLSENRREVLAVGLGAVVPGRACVSRVSVATQIDRDGIPFVREAFDHRIPNARVLGEPVQEHDGFPARAPSVGCNGRAVARGNRLTVRGHYRQGYRTWMRKQGEVSS